MSHLFQKGNKVWEKRVKFGRHKDIESPELLFEHFLAYAAEIDANPWTKLDYKGRDATPVEMEFKAPYTWNGFDNYLFQHGVTGNLQSYRFNEKKNYGDFIEVIQRIDSIIVDRKLVGATLGFFSAALIGKELGLVDKQEIAQVTTVISLGSGINPSEEDLEIPPHEYTDYDELM